MLNFATTKKFWNINNASNNNIILYLGGSIDTSLGGNAMYYKDNSGIIYNISGNTTFKTRPLIWLSYDSSIAPWDKTLKNPIPALLPVDSKEGDTCIIPCYTFADPHTYALEEPDGINYKIYMKIVSGDTDQWGMISDLSAQQLITVTADDTIIADISSRT